MNSVSILLTSVGRRSQLIECFRKAALELGIVAKIYGVDSCPSMAPAAHLVDKCFQVPRCTHSDYLQALIELCSQNGISLLIPTIDTELPVLARCRSWLGSHGISVVISRPDVIDITGDKDTTHSWLVRNGFPTLQQENISVALRQSHHWKFPVIAKPRRGSASIGVRVVGSLAMLHAVAEEDHSLIVQELARGVEHTINIFVAGNGKCLCAVPHARLETRGGEVSKGRTVRHEGMIDLAFRLGNALPGAYGPLNVQCFLSPEGDLKITEINARFGGGYPLADRAGAKFARWILEEHLRLPTSASADWQTGLTMLRYDQAVFVEPE